MMKVLFSGSRYVYPKGILWPLLDKLFAEDPELELIFGEARGVDGCVLDWAVVNKCPFTIFKADWKNKGRSAGPIRNQEMVDQKPDKAYFLPFASSIGTYDCLRRARFAEIPCRVITLA